MSSFNGATLMITGGTGSFGNTVLKHPLLGFLNIRSKKILDGNSVREIT